jgi:hypothetical protein
MWLDLPVVPHRSALHPTTEHELRLLSETLFEVSWGRQRPSRLALVEQVEALMMGTRRGCRVDGAYGVVDRLLAIADWRLGAEEIGNIVLGEIAVVEVGQ